MRPGASDTGNWYHWYSFRSMHPGGANFAFGDGSIRFLKTSIAAGTFRLLANRADGEIISADRF